jgi:TetR/AcrR family tetracycline transcriptional repressor
VTIESTSRGPGRPARLHREEIVRTVARRLAQDPGAPLTMARAAEAVGASPMALYRHFRDRDDLVTALVQHVLGDASASSPTSAPWQARVAAWMQIVYTKALEYPQLFQAAASADSVAWLPSASALAGIFEDAGLADDRTRAEAVYWVSTTALGNALVAATLGTELVPDVLHGGLATLGAATAERSARLIPHLAAISRDGFALVVAHTVAALESRLAATG